MSRLAMIRMFGHEVWFISVMIGLLLASACSSDGHSIGATLGGATSDDSSSTAPEGSDGSGSGSQTGTSSGAPTKFDVGGGGSDGPGNGSEGCSNDLKRVIDPQTGAVLEVCPPEEGCFEGQCIPACDAAAGAKGSIGCDYWIPTSPFFQNQFTFGGPKDGPCQAVMVANAWDRPALLELSRAGVDYDVELVGRIPNGIMTAVTYDPIPANGIPPGQVALLFLSHRPGAHNAGKSLECPVVPAVLQDTAAHGTDQGEAFALRSDTPLQVYDIIPYGGAATFLPSASLIYPYTAWGNSYLAISPHPQIQGNWVLAVAAEDGTSIDIRPTIGFIDGGIQNPPIGQSTNYTLDAGQVLQWYASNVDDDLTGTILVSDKPVGVFTGNTYLRVDTADNSDSGQDAAHQQIPDVNAFGSEYVGAGLVSRFADSSRESVLYRLVGIVDGTQLEWDSTPPPGAPLSVDAATIVEFESRELFTVRSQDADHPFSLTQYMSGTLGGPGCGTDAVNPCKLGDDDWVVLVPPLQYLRRYAFFVDPTYGTSSLVITRTKGPNGYADVKLSCMGNVTGWQTVGNHDQYQVSHVTLFRGGMGSVSACETSQHWATSDEPFGIMVWGQDDHASYGYPAGGNLRTLNKVDLVPAG